MNFKKILGIFLCSTALIYATTTLFAVEESKQNAEPTKQATQTRHNEPFKEAREKLKKMTPEERKAFTAKANAKWQSLSPEEKQKFKVEMRDKMDMMKKQRAERKMSRIYSLHLLEEGKE